MIRTRRGGGLRARSTASYASSHRHRGSTRSRVLQGLVSAASTSFLVNCAIGALASYPRSRTMMHRIRWAHHAIYISTASLTGAAAAGAILTHHPARTPLIAAHVPLALMPRFRGRSRMHVVTAAAAAPAFALALARALARPHIRTPRRTHGRALTRTFRRS